MYRFLSGLESVPKSKLARLFTRQRRSLSLSVATISAQLLFFEEGGLLRTLFCSRQRFLRSLFSCFTLFARSSRSSSVSGLTSTLDGRKLNARSCVRVVVF